MQLKTKLHGILEFQEKEIITFPKGLPGFQGLNKFILFKVEENPIFNILHSVEDENIGLIVISPFEVKKDYEFKLDDEVIKQLKIENSEDVLVVNTVNLNSDISKITVNLKAPIVININSGVGEQLILDNDVYKIKHPLIEE